MKTCKTGCGKMKAGGSVKKIKKMADGGSTGLVGMPRYSNNPRSEQGRILKKGGATKKMKSESSSNSCPKGYHWDGSLCRENMFNSLGSKLGVGTILAGAVGTGVKAISDKMKANKAKKEEEKKKDTATTKAKFGVSVGVKASCKQGMVRGADGNCVMSRPKFQKGGSTYLGGPSDLNTPGTMIMRADKDARSKYYTPDNIKKEGVKLSDKEIEKKVKVAKDSLYNKYMKDAKLTPEKKSTTKKPAAKKMATGGSLKPVPADKVGLAKLPTTVRNKMGYMKKGGVKKK